MANLTTQTGNAVETRTIWKLDRAHSLVEFSGKHMMITTVKGRFDKFDVELNIDVNDIAKSSVTATIDPTSINTGIEFRDNHLRSADFLDAENYPAITFVSKRIEPAGDDAYRIHGDLTIRGVTREVVLNTTFEGAMKDYEGKERIGFAATTQINRKDWGLNWNVGLEAGGVLVSDKIKIELHVEAIKQEA